jgi:hypothetical protein
MNRTERFLALAVALCAACSSSSSSPPGEEGGACMPPVSSGCASCLSAQCATESATANSACAAVSACYCACDLGDICCAGRCAGDVNFSCVTAAEGLASCAQSSCSTACAVTASGACSGDASAPEASEASPVDSTTPVDSGQDSTVTAEAGVEAGTDAPKDTGGDSQDAGPDVASEASSDAGLEAASDAASEASADAGCGTTSLILNGGFECPSLGGSGYATYSNDQTIDGWTVVGATGNVAPVVAGFMQETFTFDAEEGSQWLDLTGTTNTATGVSQAVPTAIGVSYSLSFWVSNVVDPTGIFGTTSTVDLQINGTQVLQAVNTMGASSVTQVWQQYSYQFTATSSSTTIAFINADPSNDTSNGLDGVSLVEVTDQ